MILIGNKYRDKEAKGFVIPVYRTTVLGNPFTHLTGPTKAKWKARSRHDACVRFEVWLLNQIREKDPDVCRMLNYIWSMAKRDEDVILMCCCAPEECHAEGIRRVIYAKL